MMSGSTMSPGLSAIFAKAHPNEDDLIAMATFEAEQALLSTPPHCLPTAGGLQHDEDHANASAHRCWSFLCSLARMRAESAALLVDRGDDIEGP
jgi:hypothetical protein